MQLDFIPLDRLSISPVNMRAAKRRRGDITDILPLIRARGVLVPLLVRPNGSPETFEIVAGRRRFEAASAIADETGNADPLPCAIIEPGDDAAALEASIMENSARLDPDEVTRWETFVALVRKGRTIDEIAVNFGIPELMVRRALALGNLLPRIRDLYRAASIDAATVRHLTLASKARQKDWMALWDDADARAPIGFQLKNWLFGGRSIAVGHALFAIEDYDGQIVADLFGDGGYFADSEAFWNAQNAAIEAKRSAYIEAGWREVVVVPPSESFAACEHEHCPKRKGGRVYIDVRSSGEVVVHEGYVTGKEARRLRKGEAPDTSEAPARPELTANLQTYVDLHRHAAVRTELLDHPGIALRLMVAHAIAGSPLWRIAPERRQSRSDAVAESAEASPAEAAFDLRRRGVLALLALDPEDSHVVGGYPRDRDGAAIFARLLDLDDAQLAEVLAVVMGETLACGSVLLEAAGTRIGVDMARWWQADDALFDLIRDRAVLGAIVAEVAGETIARANVKEKAKTLKAIVRNHLDGVDGRTKVEQWVPRWMRFAPSAYTDRGGVGTVDAHARIGDIGVAPKPDTAPDDPPFD